MSQKDELLEFWPEIREILNDHPDNRMLLVVAIMDNALRVHAAGLALKVALRHRRACHECAGEDSGLGIG